MAKKLLRQWAEGNLEFQDPPDPPFRIDDIAISDRLTATSRARAKQLVRKFAIVFQGSKQSLSRPLKLPPIALKLKPGAIPTRCKELDWSGAYGKIVEAFARQGLKSGLLEPASSPWASRVHIAPKPKQGQPKDANIAEQGLRLCADLRSVNDRLERTTSVYPNGIEESKKAVSFFCPRQ